MKRLGMHIAIVSTAALLSYGCAVTVVTEEPPPPQVEVRTVAPGPKAVWIDGHWRWNGHRYVWVPGFWEAHARGTWVSGHWDRRGRGHVWVPGHWAR